MEKVILSVVASLMAVSISGAVVVRNGKMLFHGIVTPEKPVPVVAHAAQELSYHLKRATGKSLPVITEKQIKNNGKYFYIGNCKANAALEPAKLPWNYGMIKINRDSIHFAGNDGDKEVFAQTNSSGTVFAVYEFLEKYLGVRWIWPGKTGEIIPVCRDLVLKESVITVKPLLRSSVWRSNSLARNARRGWSSRKAMDTYYRNEHLWLLRHRFSCDRRISGGHAFTKYYVRYFKDHPEYFSMLPTGKRGNNIYRWSRNPRNISLCVSNPGLAKLVVDNWVKTGNTSGIINASENDTDGECTCDNCLAADDSPVPAAQRRAAALREFNKKSGLWPRELGSVSNRYCKFFLNIRKEADKVAPGSLILGQIYANYSEPPAKGIKLDERIILRFCPPVMYPFSKEKIENYKRICTGWAATGARLQFRPNYTLSGHYFPIQYHKEFYDMFTYALKCNMVSSDMDSLTGQYMVQGLVNYVIASMNHRPEVPLEQLEDEFYSSFGAAKEPVKKYFDYLTDLTMNRGFPPDVLMPVDQEGGIKRARYMIYIGDTLFSPEVMTECYQLVDDAARTPGLDEVSAERIKMLRYGLKQIDLAMKVQVEFRKYQQGAALTGFNRAYAELQAFRKSIEKTWLINMSRLDYYDNLSWFKPIGMNKHKRQSAR